MNDHHARIAPAVRWGGAALATGVGALGGLGLLAYLQARLVSEHLHAALPPLDRHIGSDRAGTTTRIVWLGDSLAAGLGAVAPEVSLPHLVVTHSDEPVRLHVFAHPGATSDDVVADQIPALEALAHGLAGIGERITAIGVSVGANDIAAFTPRRRFRRNLHRIIDAADGRPLVFVSIPQLGDAIRLPHPLRAFASLRGRWLDSELRDVGRRPDVEYASVRSRPGWIARHHRSHFLSADRFHPSGAGYAVWADRVAHAFDRAVHHHGQLHLPHALDRVLHRPHEPLVDPEGRRFV